MEYRILERLTEDGEPSEVWNICCRSGSEWVAAVDFDFNSYEDAAAYAAENGFKISK